MRNREEIDDILAELLFEETQPEVKQIESKLDQKVEYPSYPYYGTTNELHDDEWPTSQTELVTKESIDAILAVQQTSTEEQLN